MRRLMTMDAKKKTHSLNEKGQALFEFIIFLPFTFILVTVFITMGNSINGAINQQKITRSYFYYELKNNSFAPNSKRVLRWYNSAGLSRTSMAVIGWKLKNDASNLYPVSSCYRLNPFLTGETTETCEDSSSVKGNEDPSAFVRIFTVYGICATPYQFLDSGQVRQDWEAWPACALKSN